MSKTKISWPKLHGLADAFEAPIVVIPNYVFPQTLFSLIQPEYYNCGIYGHNWDAYIVHANLAVRDDTEVPWTTMIFVTGDRNLPQRYAPSQAQLEHITKVGKEFEQFIEKEKANGYVSYKTRRAYADEAFDRLVQGYLKLSAA